MTVSATELSSGVSQVLTPKLSNGTRLAFSSMSTLLVLFSTLFVCAGCSDSKEEVKTPTAFMQAFGSALRSSQLGELWEALPASYQSDLTDVVQTDFPKIHPTTWQHVLSMGENIESLLTDRREMLLRSVLVVQNEPLKTLIREQGDATAALLEKLRTGSLADPATWATLDVSQWVAADLSEALKLVVIWARELIPGFGNAYDQLANNKIVILKEEPHRILTQLEAPGAAPQEQFFVRVDNTWVLQSFTLSWKDGLQQLSDGLDSLADPNTATSRELARRAASLDELAKAPDTTAFDALFVKLLGE